MQNNQNGSTSVIVAILMSFLFIAALTFGGWAFTNMQDYKNNSDQKAATAVAAAEKAQAIKLQQQFDEDAKNPNRTYHGPSTYGSVTFNYPKTWSSYADTASTSQPLAAYFHPDTIPGLTSGTAFALRVDIVNTAYADVLRTYSAQIDKGSLKAVAYVPQKMTGVSGVQAGTKLDGAISTTSTGNLQGSMVVIPVRDKTLQIYTQSTDYLGDFNNIILPSLTFSP